MALVKLENKVVEYETLKGEIKWCPMIKLSNGACNFISHQGKILKYDTKEEAEAYFKED